MEKTYVKDLKEKDQVRSVFQVARKQTMNSKNGKPFLAVTLRDRTGELDARVWENAAEVDAKFDKGDFVTVEGPVQAFQGHPQLRIDVLEKADATGLDPAEFAFTPPPKQGGHEDGRAFHQVVELIDRVQDGHIRALLRSFVDDEALAKDFKRAPAAKSIHHAYPGGLCEHTLSVMKLAHRIADHYPMADRDMLVAGAFLHDFGKIRELAWDRGGTEYTDEGRLVGHLVITAQWIHERAAKLDGFPKALETHLTHLVLSHHGRLEYGSPRLPQTLEAVLVAMIDELDSRVASWLEIMQRDPGETWTDFQKLYDRHLYKGAPPTSHGRAPVERRHKKPRKERHEREHREPKEHREPREKPEKPAEGAVAAAASEGAPAEARHEKRHERPERGERPDRGERPERGERREKGPKKPEEKLTFKPFAALSGPAEGEKPASEAAAEPSAEAPQAAPPAAEPTTESGGNT